MFWWSYHQIRVTLFWCFALMNGSSRGSSQCCRHGQWEMIYPHCPHVCGHTPSRNRSSSSRTETRCEDIFQQLNCTGTSWPSSTERERKLQDTFLQFTQINQYEKIKFMIYRFIFLCNSPQTNTNDHTSNRNDSDCLVVCVPLMFLQYSGLLPCGC